MNDALPRLAAALSDRYRIEREPRAGRPRPAAATSSVLRQRRRGGAPPSAFVAGNPARETRGERP